MRRPGSLPHAVMTEIQQVFIQGGHKVGDRLPSERELAKQLSVGRSSLREAVQGLQTMGLVERRHGVGTFFVAEPGSWCITPLKFQNRTPVRLLEELIEARLLVEVRLAALAAERATAEDIEKLQEAGAKRASAGSRRIYPARPRLSSRDRRLRPSHGSAGNAESRVEPLLGDAEFRRPRLAGGRGRFPGAPAGRTRPDTRRDHGSRPGRGRGRDAGSSARAAERLFVDR